MMYSLLKTYGHFNSYLAAEYPEIRMDTQPYIHFYQYKLCSGYPLTPEELDMCQIIKPHYNLALKYQIVFETKWNENISVSNINVHLRKFKKNPTEHNIVENKSTSFNPNIILPSPCEPYNGFVLEKTVSQYYINGKSDNIVTVIEIDLKTTGCTCSMIRRLKILLNLRDEDDIEQYVFQFITELHLNNSGNTDIQHRTIVSRMFSLVSNKEKTPIILKNSPPDKYYLVDKLQETETIMNDLMESTTCVNFKDLGESESNILTKTTKRTRRNINPTINENTPSKNKRQRKDTKQPTKMILRNSIKD